jgi:YidC/Oxa1 family membrane protein insertase
MNNVRMMLWGVLALTLFWNYQFYQQDHPESTAIAAPTNTLPEAPAANPNLSQTETNATSSPAAEATKAPVTAAAEDHPLVAAPEGKVISIDTDVLHLEIGLLGATIQKAVLRQYTQSKDNAQPVVLIDSNNADSFAALQSGYKSTEGLSIGPQTQYASNADHYEMASDQSTLTVALTADDQQGHQLIRTLVFKRGQYAIEVRDTLNNHSASIWPVDGYSDLVERWQKTERSMFNPNTYAFKGPAVFDGNKITKLNVEPTDPEQMPKTAVSGGWIAAMQHHFVVAAIPKNGPENQFHYSVKNRDYRLGFEQNKATEIKPNDTLENSTTLFIGPKLQDQLSAIGQKLEYTADYGRLTIIAEPLFWLLSMVHKIALNWGLTIIIVTILIKAAFYPLAQASGRSMAKVRLAQPRLKALQERYKDNKEELGRAMMDFYKREKINPLGGCLPTLLQMPVFIAFYWVLMESVEMRQAPFIFWLQDLSTKDPFYILPILMASAMFVQYRLNPTSPDPVQAKVFMMMPFIMSIMMAALPSGLVLYWIVNTLLTILQQYHINKLVAAEEHKLRT